MSHNPPELDAATAMMLAADFVEQEGRYNFSAIELPRTCHDVGCLLGWISFVAGLRPSELSNLDPAAQWIGYVHQGEFYDDMDRSTAGGNWHCNPTLAATGLRRLAQERMS